MARNRDDAPQAVKDAPALDLGGLVGKVKETRVVSSNPFVPVLRESFQASQTEGGNGWREVTVPGYHVRRFASALRNATQSLISENIGVRIRYAFIDDEENQVEKGDLKIVPEDSRDVIVKFTGRVRKDYSVTGNGDGSDADTDDDNGDDDGPDF